MSNKHLSLGEEIRLGKNLIFFELVPPSASQDPLAIKKSVELTLSFLNKIKVDAINIPEVIEETRNGESTLRSAIKIAPAELSGYLVSSGFKSILINRPVVRLGWKKQLEWFRQNYNDKKLHNYVLVGGESSKVRYPGLSVNGTAQKLKNEFKKEFPEILLGGITIPSRMNEGERILRKTESGLEFFTTQIIYESDSIKKLLFDYWQICLKNNAKPKMIFLSFAPITCKKDIQLFTWLGVNIPESTRDELVTGWLGTGWRSLEICQNILKDIFDFVEENKIMIPLGLNIGYVKKSNFEFSIIFLEKIAVFYRQNISFKNNTY